LTKRRPLLLGHRGARRCAPENTLTAFDLALSHGCDGFEFDVRRTADNYAVICHDPELAGLPVANSAYSTILQRQRPLLSGAGSACQNLPRLDDIVQRYGSRAFLDIELKVAGLEERAIACVEPLPADRYVVSSFLPEVLQRIHGLRPGISLGYICDQEPASVRWRELPCAFVIPEQKLVTQALVDEIHGARKKVFIWTVNSEAEMLRFAKAGADAIISDDTELLGHVFS
jgi:glycerophosphoryl diester phosphodiesterase